MKNILYIVLLISLSVQGQTSPNISPWDACQDGNPIGGGAGYDRIVTTGDIIITTSDTPSSLKTKVQAATSGQVVYINPDVRLNMGTTSLITIPAGVTVASNRGQNGSEGAFIYTNDVRYLSTGTFQPIFIAGGTNVRITGLTMRGPYGFSGKYICSTCSFTEQRVKFGIVSNYDNFEVDNVHGYNWPAAFITMSRATWSPFNKTNGGKIHHNYIHNNAQNGLGYGVDTQECSTVEIYANVMHSHRHDIQNKGNPGNGYEAYCNTIISEFLPKITSFKMGSQYFGPTGTITGIDAPKGTKVYNITSDGSGNAPYPNGGVSPLQAGNTHHNFDVHAEYYCGSNWAYGLCDPPSGRDYYVHHNDFQDDGVGRHGKTSGDMANVYTGGISELPRRTYYNRTVRPFLKNWTGADGSGYYVANTADPERNWFFSQHRVINGTVGQNVDLVGNIIGASPNGEDQIAGQTISNGGSGTGISNLYFTTSGSPTVSVIENTVNPTFDMSITTVETGENYTYTIEPLRNGLPYLDPEDFSIINGNQLRLNLTPDYENPTDSNANNTYGCDITVTSTSGATLTKNIGVVILNDPNEVGYVAVTGIAWTTKPQTINVGDTVNLAHTFTPSSPTNTGVSITSGYPDKQSIITNEGVGDNVGTDTLFIIANDQTNGTISDFMLVTVQANNSVPVVTLTGSSTVNLTVGGVYTELGATWTDTEDGSGAADILIDSQTVDVNTPGTYVVQYSYTDTDGNSGNTVTRTVNVTGISSLGFVNWVRGTNQIDVNEGTVNPTFQLEVETNETGETYSYAIAGTLDYLLFSIVNTDQLQLNITPDYDSPVDTNTNNIYGCNITATSTSGDTFTRQIGVYVLDLGTDSSTKPSGVNDQKFYYNNGVRKILKAN